MQRSIFSSLHKGFATNRNSYAVALDKSTANQAHRTKDNHTADSSSGCTGNAFGLLFSKLAYSNGNLGSVYAIDIGKVNINAAILTENTGLNNLSAERESPPAFTWRRRRPAFF